MAGKVLPITQDGGSIRCDEEHVNGVYNACDGSRRQGDSAIVGVNPEANDFKDFAMFLFTVLKRARDAFPQNQELNLSCGTVFPSELY